MTELNRNTLEKAIQQLPSHRPESKVWDALCDTLDQEDARQKLDIVVSALPAHEAPDDLWGRIADELDQEQEVTPLPSIEKGRIFRRLYRYAAAAAIALLAITAVSYNHLASTRTVDGVTISYATEQTYQVKFVADWEQDEDAFNRILNYCQEQKFVCEQPEFRILKEELMDLNDARESLKLAINRYGEDSDLISRLAQIENERSDILKQIITKI
ncbi:MAG: hypothetical protein AAFV95_26720 [Bacteroidota bacterium]